jgi:hypothetical protein
MQNHFALIGAFASVYASMRLRSVIGFLHNAQVEMFVMQSEQ